jgi:hypothetical protein
MDKQTVGYSNLRPDRQPISLLICYRHAEVGRFFKSTYTFYTLGTALTAVPELVSIDI